MSNRRSEAVAVIFREVLENRVSELWEGDNFTLETLLDDNEALAKAIGEWSRASEEEQEKRHVAVKALTKAIKEEAGGMVRQKLVETALGIYDPEGEEVQDPRFQRALAQRDAEEDKPF